MAFSVTQPNFTGKAAAGYISAALKEAKSLEFLTVLENIKYKENIQKMDGSGLVKDSDCNAFTSAGDLSLTEATLEPKSLQINPFLKNKPLENIIIAYSLLPSDLAQNSSREQRARVIQNLERSHLKASAIHST